MSLALKKLKCHSAASLGAFLAPQDDQLTSEHCIVCLKPALRLERRGQHGQNKPNQRDHRASLADSVTRKIRIGFSVLTGPNRRVCSSNPNMPMRGNQFRSEQFTVSHKTEPKGTTAKIKRDHSIKNGPVPGQRCCPN